MADIQKYYSSGFITTFVAVARAIIGQPQLLLADEPTGNVNSAQGKEVMELFARLNREGTTIVQATHSERNASYGRRIIHLLNGLIVEEEVPKGRRRHVKELSDYRYSAFAAA